MYYTSTTMRFQWSSPLRTKNLVGDAIAVLGRGKACTLKSPAPETKAAVAENWSDRGGCLETRTVQIHPYGSSGPVR